MSLNFYEQYIASDKWRQKRLEILERDRNECQTCLCTERLEVHHKTYKRLGNELSEDLIILCHWCHEAITNSIRERRYAKKEIKITSTTHINLSRSSREFKTNVRTEIEVSDSKSMPRHPPQWANRRSVKPIFKGLETDILEEGED